MNATTVEWIAIGLFFACFHAYTLLEAYWLSYKNKASFGKAFAYSFATNTVGISIGFFVSFVIFAVLLMLAFGGTFENLSGNDWRIWTAVIVGALFPLVLLILVKRVSVRLFRLALPTSPWIFSAVSSMALLVFILAVPTAFVYLV